MFYDYLDRSKLSSEYESRISNRSMSTSFDANDSGTNSDLSYVDRAVQDIMDNDSNMNITDCSKNIMKIMIDSLHDQVISLKEEIVYLRTESNVKNSTIGRLFHELDILRKKKSSFRLC